TPPRPALELAWLTLDVMDVIELNEAFAAQVLACLRELGVEDEDPRVNPNGGAIALGHPLGMSGARLVLTASHELQRTKKRYALCTVCIGVGQGMAVVVERVEMTAILTDRTAKFFTAREQVRGDAAGG